MMMGLTRQEKEGLVLELYGQGKTYHEIAKEARVSLRDIGPILKKSGIERSLSQSSQAYKLFSEGKSPNEVAITLNVREPEVTKLYGEYWRLNQLYDLNQIYEETRGNFSYLVELWRLMKAENMTVAHAIRLLRIANRDLPSVEYRCQELRCEEASLRAGNSNAARTFQELSDSISDEYKILNQYRLLSNQEKQETDKIQSTKLRLEEFVECFLDTNEVYLKIKETIKQEILYTLKNPRQLVRIALISLILSSRKDPNNFHALYYNMNIPPEALLAQALSVSSDNIELKTQNHIPSTDEQNSSSNCCDEVDYEKILLAESEILYNKIIDIVINKTINSGTNWRYIVLQRGDTKLSSDQKETSQYFSTYPYQKEEGQAFIQSEVESEEG
jgi:hypothetical protein